MASRAHSKSKSHHSQLKKRKQEDKENSPFKSPINKKKPFDAEPATQHVPETPIRPADSVPSSAGSLKRHQTLLSSASTGRVSRDTVSTPPLHLRVSKEEMNKKFEEWMKVAADNKINTSNSWNLALIDYFHDMTILREGDSVNFQKASCTLDGCVKIYTSRVDSVDYETRKLLHGISKDLFQGKKAEEDNDEEDESGSGTARSRLARSTNTLEKSFASLNVKKLDLEYNVDPLFKKTSAGFDETGNRSLLLNRLQTSKIGKLIFDATDVTTDFSSTEPSTANEDSVPLTLEETNRTCFGGNFSVTYLFNIIGDSLREIDSKTLCPSLAGFLIDDDSTEFKMPTLNSVLADLNSKASVDFNGDNLIADAAAVFDSLSDNLNDNNNDAWSEHAADNEPDSEIPENGFPMSSPRKPLNTHASISGSLMDEENAQIDFDFFDNELKRSWAGPQFYRRKLLRHQIGNPEARTISASDVSASIFKSKLTESSEESLPSRLKAVSSTFISFTDIDSIPTDEDVFSPYKQRLQIKLEKKRKTNLLPLDTHFSSRDLLRLFLKPNFIVKWRPHSLGTTRHNDDDGDRVDEQFWQNDGPDNNPLPVIVEPEEKDFRLELLQAAGDDEPFADDDANADFLHYAAPVPEYNTETPVDLEFEKQLVSSLNSMADLAEAFPNLQIKSEASCDEPAGERLTSTSYSQAAGVSGAGEYGELARINEPARAWNSRLSYAKQAKRVDIHLLKTNIWKEISLEPPAGVHSKSNTPVVSPKSSPVKASSVVVEEECHKFTGLVTGLKRFYPNNEQLKDISVPFCFICLLHLANEEGLLIENDETGTLDELFIKREQE